MRRRVARVALEAQGARLMIVEAGRAVLRAAARARSGLEIKG